MKPAIEIDASKFVDAMEKAKFTQQEIMDVLGAGSAVVKTTQKLLVPKDTHATEHSVKEYPNPKGLTSSVDIGPSTEYAPYIEYGTSNPNYPIQPFIVPSATGNSKARTIKAMTYAMVRTLIEKGLL